MTEEIKRIDIKEFHELGFIQEINRRLLHPCGLALEVIIDMDTGKVKLGGVWDYRDDPEGMAFADDVLDVEKARSVEELYHSKDEVRNENFGWVIQPVDED